jgi:membrane protein required for colicin V production
MTPIILDTTVAIIIILSVAVAYFRGFLKEALTIVTIGGGAASAFFLGPLLSPGFQRWMGAGQNEDRSHDLFGFIPPEVAGTFFAYLSAFFAVFLLLMFAGMSISGSLKAMGFGPMDRFLGMIFGFARAVLLIFLFYMPFGYFMQPQEYPAWAKESLSVPVLDKMYLWFQDYISRDNENADGKEGPDSVKGKLERMKKGLKEQRDNPTETPDLLPDESGYDYAPQESQP